MLAVLCFLFLAFSGCSFSSSSDLDRWMQRDGRLKVLSTTAMIHDLVKEIGKERVDALALIQGEIDPHSYELVKGDEEKFAFASLVFYNGLGLEHGASLYYKLKSHPFAYALGERVRRKHPALILEKEGQLDPHLWMDISLWKEAAFEIAELLKEKDPAGKESYEHNLQLLLDCMLKTHDEICRSLKEIPQEMRYLVTSHDAFGYFVRAYLSEPDERETGAWRARLAAPEGLAPDGQLGASHIKGVIAFLFKHRVRCLFSESNVSRASLKKIVSSCLAIGHEVRISQESLFGDAMGGRDSEADTYLKMIRCDAEVIKKELLCMP